MATIHKTFSASSMSLISLCPGSVEAKKALPEKVTSEAAESGTRIHTLFEQYMKGDLTPPPKKLTGDELVEAQIAAIAGLEAKRILSEIGLTMDDCEMEKLRDLAEGYEDAGGSSDLDGYRAFGDMVVMDLKTGRQQVAAEENLQLLTYAVAKLNSLDPFTRVCLNNCHMIILQPDQEPPHDVTVRKWTVPVADLLAYEALLKGIVDRARRNPHEREAGPHCKDKYCDARATCPAYIHWINEQSDGTVGRVLAGEKLSADDVMLSILNVSSELTDLVEQAKKLAKGKLEINPDTVPGWYLQPMTAREWENEKQAEKELKALGFKIDDIAPRKFVSVAQAEKLIKARKLDATLPAVVTVSATPHLKKGEAKNVFEAFAPDVKGQPDPKTLTAPANTEPAEPTLALVQ